MPIIAPIPAHSLLLLLLQVGLLLLLAVVLGRLAMRLRMPALVGELTAGLLIGPTVLGNSAPDLSRWLFPAGGEQFHLLDSVGSFGVLLLVGVTGIELDLGMVRRQGLTAARISAFGLVIPLSLGIATGFLVPRSLLSGGTQPTVFALFLGTAMCVSAIPVIAKTLADMNLVHRNVGQLTLAAGMADDAVGWVLLSVVSAMATTGLRTQDWLSSVGYLALVGVMALVIGRPVVGRVMGWAGRTGEPGPPIALATIVIVLSGAATQAMGLEAVFGAFIGGILVGTNRDLDRGRLMPLRTVVMAVLAPIFFATAGLRVDLGALGTWGVLLTAVVVLLVAIVGKFVGAFAGALLSGLNRWEALALGAGMNARGVVEIVVAMVGLRLGVLTPTTYTIIVLVAVVTSLMAPPLLRVAVRNIEQTAEEDLRQTANAGLIGASGSRLHSQ
ncbi:cation:proton antiporter [Actinoplanes sp. NPDC004185]